MAYKLGINLQVYQALEDKPKSCAIADALDISADYLLGKSNVPYHIITDENLDEINEILQSLNRH